MKKIGFFILVIYCLLAYSPTAAIANVDNTAESNGYIRFIEGDLESIPQGNKENKDKQFNKLPETGDASILSSVALGFLFIGVGSVYYLKEKRKKNEYQ